jgi:hypothetical protein
MAPQDTDAMRHQHGRSATAPAEAERPCLEASRVSLPPLSWRELRVLPSLSPPWWIARYGPDSWATPALHEHRAAAGLALVSRVG